MRTSDSPYVIDWFVISLRWLAILGLVASLVFIGHPFSWPNLLVIGLIVWNLFLSAIAGTNRRLYRHREICLGVDIAVTVPYFILVGGIPSPSYWILVLPVFTATLYFDWRGAIFTSLALAGVEVAFTLFRGPTAASIIYALIVAGLLLLVAAILGFASRRLLSAVRKERLKPIEARELARKVENDRLNAVNERVRAIYASTGSLIGTLDLARVLETVLDLSSSALATDPETGPDDRLVTAVMLFWGDELVMGSARGLTGPDLGLHLSAQQGLLAQVIRTGEPILSEDVSTDAELARIVALRTCRSVYCFPLRNDSTLFGVMLVAHPEPMYFTTERREAMDILGGQLVIAIQNAQLYKDLVGEKKRLLDVQDEARKKLSRDLQDGPAQSISAIAMRINLAKRLAERDVTASLVELAKIEGLAQQTGEQIRHMIFTMRPLILESEGLVAALESVANKTGDDQEVIIRVDENLLNGMDMDKQGMLFFITEVAINNARKHAESSHIFVTLSGIDKDISMLEIRDDGLGFDIEALNRAYEGRSNLGMVNLRERAEFINGFLHLESEPGRGTKVQVFFPMTEEGVQRLQHAKVN